MRNYKQLHIMRIIFTVVISTIVIFQNNSAQEMAVPITTQFSLLTKIMALEKNAPARFGSVLNVGIVYQRKNIASLTAKNNALTLPATYEIDCLGTVALNTIPVEYFEILAMSPDAVKSKFQILYVAPLRSADLSKITELTQREHIMSFTGIPEYVDDGIAVGIGIKNGKPEIMINLAGAKAEGLNFSSKLLSISKVIE